MNDAGTLLTERLSMRWLTRDDADLMLEIWNDPEFLLYVGDRGIRDHEGAQAALETGPLALYRDFGYGPYRLALRGSDEPVGICGLFRRENFDAPDIGFALLPPYRQQGFAGEAALAVLTEARDRLRLPRVNAIVAPENGASVRLIEKLGLRFARMVRMPGENRDVGLYAIEWRDNE